MCGIVGVAGKILAKEENIFKTLLCLDTIRGPDSTGVLAVSGSTGFDIFKKIGTPWNCFGEKGFEKLFKYTNVLMLGHNRAATVGHITDKNAHPFDVGNIIGVHNGTIRQEFKLDDHQHFDVDSETVLHNFAKNGVAQTVKILDGAFAIAFYDKRDHTLHLLRNKERPLWYAYTKDHKTLFWASEPWMLTIACARYEIELETIAELEVMKEHSFKLPSEAPGKIGPLPDFVVEPLVKEERSYSYRSTWKATPSTSMVTTPTSGSVTEIKRGIQDVWYKKLVSFVGKDVNFGVSGFVDGKHQKFVRAYLELPGADVVEVRIFMDQKNKKFKELTEGKDKIWCGHVKRANTAGMLKGYLLLDNRTIKVTDGRTATNVIDLVQKSFNVFRNKPVTAQEWLDATSCGCDNCGTIPQLKEKDDLEWYDPDRFFCRECYNTQHVQSYLSLLPTGD